MAAFYVLAAAILGWTVWCLVRHFRRGGCCDGCRGCSGGHCGQCRKKRS